MCTKHAGILAHLYRVTQIEPAKRNADLHAIDAFIALNANAGTRVSRQNGHLEASGTVLGPIPRGIDVWVAPNARRMAKAGR